MRVKLLEAFAAGIPVVSTPLGAEGLAGKDGEICALAEDPAEFARKIVELFDDPEKAQKAGVPGAGASGRDARHAGADGTVGGELSRSGA